VVEVESAQVLVARVDPTFLIEFRRPLLLEWAWTTAFNFLGDDGLTVDERIRHVCLVYGPPESLGRVCGVYTSSSVVPWLGDRVKTHRCSGKVGGVAKEVIRQIPAHRCSRSKQNLYTGCSVAIFHLSKDATVDYDDLLHFGLIGSRRKHRYRLNTNQELCDTQQ